MLNYSAQLQQAIDQNSDPRNYSITSATSKYTYKFNSSLNIKDIFRSKSLVDICNVCTMIILPAIDLYTTKYPEDTNIYKIIDDTHLVHNNYDKLYVISKDYINIRIIPMNNKKYYKMFIMIHLFIENHICICDLIYYYTHRYFYCKKKNINAYDLSLLPMSNCNSNPSNITYIKNWMRFMDIPL